MKKDKNHNPRKGTETDMDTARVVRIEIRDKNHNPRKGTETTSQQRPFLHPVFR